MKIDKLKSENMPITKHRIAKRVAKLLGRAFGISTAESSISTEHYRKFEHLYFDFTTFGKPPDVVGNFTN